MVMKEVFGEGHKQVLTGFVLFIVGAVMTVGAQQAGWTGFDMLGLVVLLLSVMTIMLGMQVETAASKGATESFDVAAAIKEMRAELHSTIEKIAGSDGEE